MAELADAQASEACGLNTSVEVQLLSSALVEARLFSFVFVVQRLCYFQSASPLKIANAILFGRETKFL